ncbi:hypothetical protein V8F20_002044 [Naviculisporaceae sp. PSN 640]
MVDRRKPALSNTSRKSYYISICGALQISGLIASGLVMRWILDILVVAIGFRFQEELSSTLMSSTLKLFS